MPGVIRGRVIRGRVIRGTVIGGRVIRGRVGVRVGARVRGGGIGLGLRRLRAREAVLQHVL